MKMNWRKLISLLLVLCVFAMAMPALADETGSDPGYTEGGDQGGDNGSQGDKDDQGGSSGNQGGDSGDQGGDSGDQGGSSGDQGGDSGDQGGDKDDQGGDNGDQGGDKDDQGGDNGDQGGDKDDQGGDNGDQGGNAGEPDPSPEESASATPTVEPTEAPTAVPTQSATDAPTATPTAAPTPEPTVPPLNILMEQYLGDYDVEEGAQERTGASAEDVQIVRDESGEPVDYRLIPISTESALLVEAVQSDSAVSLCLRMSQVRRFVEDLGIRTLYFRSGDVTLYVPLEGLLNGDPAKLVHLLDTTYADVSMELIDLSAINFAAEPVPELSQEVLRAYDFVISIAPVEAGAEVNVALRVGEETVDLGFLATYVQICLHGEGTQVGYSNWFGMEEQLNAARGNLPAVSDEALTAYETHFDDAAPWADVSQQQLTQERVSGLVVGYVGFGNYALGADEDA